MPRLTRLTRTGLTLVELVLVISLLVIATALTAPAMHNAFASVRLKRAGDQVLAAWARARAEAIETGEVWQCRFRPETNVLCIEPWSAVDAASSAPTGSGRRTGASAASAGRSTAGGSTSASRSAGASAAGRSPSAPVASGAADDGTDSSSVERQLGEGLKCYRGERGVDDPLRPDVASESLTSTGSEWSEAILFFPDGSTSDAALTLALEDRLFLRLHLRGLTGVARASAVLTRNELDSYERR
jgi:Tfp pilus assembly protein FimT